MRWRQCAKVCSASFMCAFTDPKSPSYLATPRCGCARAAHYLGLRYVFVVIWSRSTVALRHSEKRYATSTLHHHCPGLRAVHLSPRRSASICGGLHYAPSVPVRSGFLFFLIHRPWLSGGVVHTGRAHRVGTDQEESPLHGRWWCQTGHCSCRLVRRGYEHDHDSSWASGPAARSLFERTMVTAPASVSANIVRRTLLYTVVVF